MPTQRDAWISVAEMRPERSNPAEETGFASGLQAALVHNGLYLFLTPSGSDLVRSPRPIPFYLPYGKLNITAYITNAKFSNSCCNTGSEHPDISTRPTASRAACGDTP